MSLSLLGAPSGTLIKGTHNYNKDLTLLLHSVVYPYINDQEFIKYTTYGSNKAEIIRLARRYRSDLFNESSSDDYIIDWLTNNRVQGNAKRSDYLPDHTLIEVVASAGENSKLPPSIVDGVMSIGEIQKALPVPTLSFYYHPWDIVLEDYEIHMSDALRKKSKQNVIWNGELLPLCDVDDSLFTRYMKIYKLNINREDIYLVGEQTNTNSYVQELIDEIGLRDTYNRLKQSTSYFTPAGYKSLLQKLIRVRPGYLKLEDASQLVATKALMSTFLMLYESGGSFVPDLQRFVSGKESAFKRLAVSIVEDGYIDDMKLIASMLTDALICQYDRKYNPSKLKLSACLDVCYAVMKDVGYFTYQTDADTRVISIKDVVDEVSLSAYLIGTIGSFKGDIAMFNTLNTHRCVSPHMNGATFPSYMLHRCIDHHWAPSVAYLFPHEFVRSMTSSVKTKEVLNPLLRYIWDHSSSINTRRDDIKSIKDWSIIGDAQIAYHMFNLGMHNGIYNSSTNYRNEVIDTLTVEYTLPESYLSVHVGIYYPKPNRHGVMACLDANNIYNISTSKIPSRDIDTSNKSSILSPDIEIKTIELMKTELRTRGIKGVKLLTDSTYTINDSSLTEWLNRSVQVSVFNRSDNKSLLLATDTDDAVYVDYDKPVDTTRFTTDEINRAVYHILRSDTRLQLPTISKSGEGVTKSDIGAYWLLNQIASNYPYLLKQRRIGVFDIPHHTLLRRLLNKILGISTKRSTSRIKDTMLPNDMLKRKPYQHQIETLEEMKQYRNNFIWIPVGMGKTYITITYIRYLMQIGKVSKYILYTMPTSAFEGVKVEFAHWNIRTNIITSKNKELVPLIQRSANSYVVNLINHDHLRVISYELESYINDAIFIVDEVHKTLADTKRTDTALTLASLASRFILMTGTPLINTKMVMLINWLQLIVKYPINKHNFWIAITSMISKQVNTGVLVKKENIYVPMSSNKRLLKKFNQLVGPSLGGVNSKVTEKDFRAAIDLTYERVNDELVNHTIKHMNDGVFLIANNKEHQSLLYNALIAKGINSDDIGMMSKDNLYNLVGINDPGPKIIITTTRLSEGYTLTKLGRLVTSVYFSNLATRQQLEGRINRITQKRKEVTHYIIYTDLLDLILKNYNHASSIANAMKMIAK